jgi:hypothetical protein
MGKSTPTAATKTIAAAALVAAALTTAGCHRADAPNATPPIAVVPPVATAPAPPNHPPRRLEDANRKELETTLPKGAPVEITAPEGDEEAYRLAQEIRIFLRSQKYGVADIIRGPADPSAKGVGLEALPGGKWRVIVGQPE